MPTTAAVIANGSHACAVLRIMSVISSPTHWLGSEGVRVPRRNSAPAARRREATSPADTICGSHRPRNGKRLLFMHLEMERALRATASSGLHIFLARTQLRHCPAMWKSSWPDFGSCRCTDRAAPLEQAPQEPPRVGAVRQEYPLGTGPLRLRPIRPREPDRIASRRSFAAYPKLCRAAESMRIVVTICLRTRLIRVR